MPNYGSPVPSLVPGDSLYLFNAETPAAPQASAAFSRGYNPSPGLVPTTFTIQFAAAPTSTLAIQGSNVDADASYQTLFTSTSKQQDFYTDSNSFAFYRAKLLTQTAGGAVTVIAQR